MWFKKKANISGFNANTAYDGTDWRTNSISNFWPALQVLPNAADTNKYFYLPALGYYTSSKLYRVGSFGQYWSSSADAWGYNYAYSLNFSAGSILVDRNQRINGYRITAFE